MKTAKHSSKAQKIKGIYRRGNVFWYQRMVEGRRIQVSLETSEYGEAVEKAMKILADPFLNVANPFADEIKAFLAYKRDKNQYSQASVSAKQYALVELSKFVLKSPASVSTADVERFYSHLQARVAESTAQGYLMTIRSFYNWLRKTRKAVRSNPVDGVELAELVHKSRMRFCSKDECAKLLDNCKRDDLRFVLFCGFHAGMRKNEIVEARPDWFNLERGTVTIPSLTETFRSKDSEERTVPLTAAFKTFLAEYGLRAPFMLQPDVKHGAHRYRYDFRRPFADYMKEQGCAEVTPHVMRHTFASLHASAGTSIYKIAKWMGDGIEVVQDHYAKLLPKDEDIEKAFA